MFMCTDCQLPTPLDDTVETFADGSCRCLTCALRTTAGDRRLTPALRSEIAAVLGALDAA
jgi:hypothetical protein